MTYWDASALVPLLVSQTHSAAAHDLLRADPQIMTWWGSSTECFSALQRLHRDGFLPAPDLAAAEQRLLRLRSSWDEILPTEAARREGFPAAL